MKEKKLRDAYARCCYQQFGFGHKVMNDMAAAVVLSHAEISEYRRGLPPYSQAQIKKHIKDFDVARVIATDAYVSGAAMVEIIHGADMVVSVGGGYSTLCTRLAESKIARYEIYDVENEEILEDKYRRMGLLNQEIKDIKRVNYEEGFLEKIRFTKKCFCDLTGIDALPILKQLGEKLSYDSAVTFIYSGDYRGLEKNLSDWGFRIYEYSNGTDLTERFFRKGNFGPSQYHLKLDESFCMVLAVKKP